MVDVSPEAASEKTTDIVTYYCLKCGRRYDRKLVLCPYDNGTLYPGIRKRWLSWAVVLLSTMTILAFILAMALPKGRYYDWVGSILGFGTRGGAATLYVLSAVQVILLFCCIALMFGNRLRIASLKWPLMLAALLPTLEFTGRYGPFSAFKEVGLGQSIWLFWGPGITMYVVGILLSVLIGILALADLLRTGFRYGWSKKKWEIASLVSVIILHSMIGVRRINRRLEGRGSAVNESSSRET